MPMTGFIWQNLASEYDPTVLLQEQRSMKYK